MKFKKGDLIIFEERYCLPRFVEKINGHNLLLHDLTLTYYNPFWNSTEHYNLLTSIFRE